MTDGGDYLFLYFGHKPTIKAQRKLYVNYKVISLFQSTRPSKLEKADILEMTVEFIQKRINTSPIERSINIAGLHGISKCFKVIYV